MQDLKPKQVQLLEAYLTEPSFEASYKKVGLSKPTALKYRNDPAFKQAYTVSKRKMMEEVTTRLQQASFEAVDVLREVMNDVDSTPTARIQGAKAVIENAYKGIELEDISLRLEAIEESLK